MESRELRKKDYGKAIQFAITGMRFNLYLDSRLLLNLYGRYFWYSELNCATQVIAVPMNSMSIEDLSAPVKRMSFWILEIEKYL